jgi:sulfite reductase (NADPH) flavoprotein alpha-component
MIQRKDMLTGPKLKLVQDLVGSLSREELVWTEGYLAGILAGNGHAVQEQEPLPALAAPATAGSPQGKMTIVYGTETGNAKKLATDLAAKAKKKNLQVKLASLDQYRLTDITKEESLFVVISTQGDGEPPAAAQKFYDHIHRNGFRLDNLKYSVLALGDTSYPMFCKTGEDVDRQLSKLGGTPIIPIRKCDLDYETEADQWFNEVLAAVAEKNISDKAPVVKPAATSPKSNKKIYTATVLANTNLHDKDSSKETWHIELAVEEEVDYLPGDSIGIVPRNPELIVNTILELTGISRDKQLQHKDASYTVAELLNQKLNITYLHERVVKKYAEIVQQSIPETKMDLLDLLRIYPIRDAAQFESVIQALPAQSPRIYTIASSNAAHSGEVHLTVERDIFSAGGQTKSGLCSAFLAELQTGATIEFFVQKNKRFKLPDASKDILMIGPGTGIAAFRSFLSERDALGASGKNWLFFGEDHFVSDFLYQTEIQNWAQTGVLNKVSLAFSKDRGKLTVQHKLLEHGKEVFDWIAGGAHVYLCGQKAPMGVEAENALLSIIERYSGLSSVDTLAYFEKMKEEGRFSKDVY